MQPRLLIVDDDERGLLALSAALEARMPQIIVDTALTGDEAIKLVEQTDYDVIISDIRMPGRSGLSVLKEARTLRPDSVVVLMTAYGRDKEQEAYANGACAFVVKPIDVDKFTCVVGEAIQRANMLRRARKPVLVTTPRSDRSAI